jgi:serine protease inhibitor ecotin
MAYRKRIRGSAAIEAMKRGREAARLAGPAPDYPQPLPELRRTIIVVDHDFGTIEHRIDLYRTNRVDCYRAVVGGIVWKKSIGWARVLEAVRKSFVRVLSSRQLS